jgi:hypothetical protein
MMTAAPLTRRASVGVSKPAGRVRVSPAYEGNSRRTLATTTGASCYGGPAAGRGR